METTGVELDKFKRRLIRAVARLLLQEKKPEDEIWKELKKETGCDCELLWIRMRALTLKKLDRLLAANDCMDAVPKAARMSVTDWLLVDQVLVHQKIDFIGQNVSKKKDFPALVELFKLVQMFGLENQPSDKLAEAWSLATLSYNNKGHQCSPMLLQRRWYQLKEVTRTNFYEYWYMYRGSVHRINVSEPFKPSPLQTDIARTFRQLIVQPYESWEALIEKKMVIMPDEFEKKMKERLARRRRSTSAPKPTEDVPDLVMIEPRIETIDLRLEPDDNATEEDKQKEDGKVPVPPLVPIVKIKQEPKDDIDETQIQLPKKSIYEVVLESTALEYEQIDSMDAEDLTSDNYDGDVEEIEETPVRDEEESTLPQISSVFGNVTDTSVLANIDEDRVYLNAENSEANDINTEAVSDTIAFGDVQARARDNDGDTDACDIITNDSAPGNQNKSDNSAQNIQISGTGTEADVCDIVENVSDNVVEQPGVGDHVSGPDDVNVISDDDDGDTSAKADATLTGEVDGTSIIGTVSETNVIDNFEETAATGNAADTCGINEGTIAHIPSENVTASNNQTAYPTIIAALNTAIINAITTVTDSLSKDVEMIDTASHPVVIINSDDDDDDDNIKTGTNSTVEDIIERRRSIDQPMEVDSTHQDVDITALEPLKVGLIAEGKDERDTKPDVTGFNFGELPRDISFVDEGIEFVDDGIIYVDEDGHGEPNIKSDAGNEDEDTPKIDAKLLMCPIVYTTRLDDMYMFHKQPFDHVTDKHLLDDMAKKSNPMKQEPKETVENVTINYLGENIESVTVNNTKTIEHVQKTISTIEKVSVNNDTIEIIKKEPVIINSETNADVEHNLENDDNVTSDDDDSEYVIDESQKVKPTSYLLQKPRSRRYNPIQLCKNPDFNTRLKRLSLGFYSDPRNRILIKSCKPLTIDLSKAFESKLVSGTLYLKPLDHNVITEVIDDTQSQNVSVLPSALPAQSLIDNSKDADILPLLRRCLEASKQPIPPPPENIPTATERNKVINLPDITEIRRINQRLLTAEVTPIQVHNNQPQVPVTIVSSSITPTRTAQNAVTIPETEQDLRPRVTQANDARGPPKLLDITDDLPAKSSTNQHPTTTTHNNNTHTSIGRNTFDTLRPRFQASFSGRPPRMQNAKRFCPPKQAVWKPRQFRDEIPWLSRNNEVTVNSMKNETLLTCDALNKMLFLLTKTSEAKEITQKYMKRKAKGKSQTQQMKRGRRPKTNLDDSSVMLVSDKEDEASETQKSVTQKPKINIKSATNYPPDKEKIGAATEYSKKKVKYCCWSKQRMLQILFSRARIPPHPCLRLCTCCCRHLLADYLIQDQKIKSAEEQNMRAAVNPYGITKESVENENTDSSETFEENFAGAVVLSDQIFDLETVPEDTPSVDEIVTNIESIANNTTTANQPIDIEDIEDDVPALGREVSVKTTAVMQTAAAVLTEPTPRPVRRTLVAVPIPKKSKPERKVGKPACRVTRCTSPDKLSGGVTSILPPNVTMSLNTTNSPNTTQSPSTTIVPTMPSPPSLSKLLAVKKAKVPYKLKTNMPPPPPPLNKPFVPPKHSNEKMIFLNSKQISEQPTASPVFLGKNQILLTTVKFPHNLKLFQDSKKALQSSLNLPNGVHIILLADGSISYKIDFDVEVNAMDMADMKEKIATLQEYMNLRAAQEEEKKKQNVPLTPAGIESEVVDLVGDDDESASNLQDHQNTETALLTDVQITEGSVTINSDDSPDVRYNSKTDTSKETEENPAAKNMNNYVNNETENKQNETTDRCAVTDIQEGVKETSQNQMVSVSTEQAQSGPSIEKISAETDDQPIPCSQTESTDLHEVSAGQVQGQSEPSGQKVSTEVLDHPELATQNVSTEEPEESRSKPSGSKTKNILSDLMEMSGIFDEDMTPEVEEAVPAQPAEQITLAQTSSVSPLLATEVVDPPVQEVVAPPVSTGTRPIIPSAFNAENSIPPKVSSPVGELTPITSLYELKYACANKGVFFKLDFETGYLVPINVCMKPAVVRPTVKPRLAPKSVIDLTDDDDKQEHENKQLDSTTTISPTKRSLLLVNNKLPGGFAGPVKPVKLFKAPKPNVLQRLNINKLKRDSVNPSFMNYTISRKEFLKNINMNADLSTTSWRCNIRRITDPNAAVQKSPSPTPTTSHPQPVEPVATTILSDGDSSDDEPLAKIAKRQKENANAPEKNRDDSGSESYRYKNLESSTDDVEPEASVEPLIEIELLAADVENTMNDDDLGDGETPVEEQNESELTADTEPVYMSEDENDFMDQEAPFDLNENDEEEEDICILGV